MIQTGCGGVATPNGRANRIDMPALAEASSVLDPALYERRASSSGIVAELCQNSGPKSHFARAPVQKHVADDGSVKFWNANTGLELMTLGKYQALMETAAFSPNGDYFVASGDDHILRFSDGRHSFEH